MKRQGAPPAGESAQAPPAVNKASATSAHTTTDWRREVMGSEKKKDNANPFWLQRLLPSLNTHHQGTAAAGSKWTFLIQPSGAWRVSVATKNKRAPKRAVDRQIPCAGAAKDRKAATTVNVKGLERAGFPRWVEVAISSPLQSAQRPTPVNFPAGRVFLSHPGFAVIMDHA